MTRSHLYICTSKSHLHIHTVTPSHPPSLSLFLYIFSAVLDNHMSRSRSNRRLVTFIAGRSYHFRSFSGDASCQVLVSDGSRLDHQTPLVKAHAVLRTPCGWSTRAPRPSEHLGTPCSCSRRAKGVAAPWCVGCESGRMVV